MMLGGITLRIYSLEARIKAVKDFVPGGGMGASPTKAAVMRVMRLQDEAELKALRILEKRIRKDLEAHRQ